MTNDTRLAQIAPRDGTMHIDKYDLITPALKYINYVIDRDLTPEQRAKLILCDFPIEAKDVELEGGSNCTENKLKIFYEYKGRHIQIMYPLRHLAGLWADDVMQTFVNSLHDLGIVIGKKEEVRDYID